MYVWRAAACSIYATILNALTVCALYICGCPKIGESATREIHAGDGPTHIILCIE